MTHTITLNELDLSITYSLKDDSPRGCHTVNGSELKIGDKIVINNYFTEIVEPVADERDRETVIKDIIEFFEENESIFERCIEELDSYNGYLNDDRYYEMEYLNEFYSGTDPIEILERAYYGRDDDTWTTDSSGNKQYGEFNPNREYFTYNGYGNLISTDYKDYSSHLDSDCIESMSDNRYYIDTIDEYDDLKMLFDELDGGTEE